MPGAGRRPRQLGRRRERRAGRRHLLAHLPGAPPADRRAAASPSSWRARRTASASSTVAEVQREAFGCESFERPVLVPVPGVGWRLYLSCATPGSKHWWVDSLTAATPAELPDGERRVVLPGDDRVAVKDPVVDARRRTGWRDVAVLPPAGRARPRGPDDHPPPDQPRRARAGPTAARCSPGAAGRWDARGARVTAVVGHDPLTVLYDGRADAASNWHETTGVARWDGTRLVPDDELGPIASPHSDGALALRRRGAAAGRPDPLLRRGRAPRRGARPGHLRALTPSRRARGRSQREPFATRPALGTSPRLCVESPVARSPGRSARRAGRRRRRTPAPAARAARARAAVGAAVAGSAEPRDQRPAGPAPDLRRRELRRARAPARTTGPEHAAVASRARRSCGSCRAGWWRPGPVAMPRKRQARSTVGRRARRRCRGSAAPASARGRRTGSRWASCSPYQPRSR